MTRSNNSAFFRNAAGEVYSSYDGKPFQAADVALTKKEGEAATREQAKTHLRKLLKPGTKVYTILTHRSASGMQRSISCFVVSKNELIKLDYWIATAQGVHIDDKNGGIKRSGCGMDMGFDLVYNIGRMIYPNGTKKPHGTRNGQPDSDGGYALKQSWL